MITTIALWLVAGLVGYCVLCWIVGFSLHFAGKIHYELQYQSTVLAPIMPIALIAVWISDTREQMRFARVRRASQWIADELQKKGIEVKGNYGTPPPEYEHLPDGTTRINIPDGYNPYVRGCKVRAEPRKDQINAYQDVYKRAIEHFDWLTPEQICSGATPREPLDKAWAQRIGIREYFAQDFNVCVKCGSKKTWHELRWSNEASHARSVSADWVSHYRLKDDSRCSIRGHLCDACIARNEYTLLGSNPYREPVRR